MAYNVTIRGQNSPSFGSELRVPDGLHHQIGQRSITQHPEAVEALVSRQQARVRAEAESCSIELEDRQKEDLYARHSPLLYSEYLEVIKRYRSILKEHGRGDFVDVRQLRLARAVNLVKHTAGYDGYVRYLVEFFPGMQNALSIRTPVAILEEDRQRHTLLIGGSGSGKSETMKRLIYDQAQNPEWGAALVIDPHEDFAMQVAKWREFSEGDRLVLLDPTLEEGKTFAVNPLDLAVPTDLGRDLMARRLIDVLEQLMPRTGGDMSMNMEAVLVPCLVTLMEHPGSTLLDLVTFLTDEKNHAWIQKGKKAADGSHAEFFETEFVHGSLESTKSAIRRRLHSLLGSPVLRRLLCNPTTVDLRSAVNGRKIIVANLKEGIVGTQACEAFGRFLVASVVGIALERASVPQKERVPVHLYIDEAHQFVSPALIRMLVGTRKFRAHLTMATQSLGGGGISPTMRDAMVSSTEVKLAGKSDLGGLMARAMGLEAGSLGNLEQGQFYLKTGKRAPVLVHVESPVLDWSNCMTSDQWGVVVDRQLAAYYRDAKPDKPEDPKPRKRRKIVY